MERARHRLLSELMALVDDGATLESIGAALSERAAETRARLAEQAAMIDNAQRGGGQVADHAATVIHEMRAQHTAFALPIGYLRSGGRLNSG